MPSEVGGARAGGARGRIAQVWQSAYSVASERIEKRKQLVVGSKAASAPRSRINFVQCRLLHLEIGLDIDLCRLDRFVPEPQGEPTLADHRVWQDVYRPTTPLGEVYLKLTVIDDLLIVTFKEL